MEERGPEMASFLATVHGLVQGVYFRSFVARRARELGLTGYVQNLPGGTAVEVRAEGQRDRLLELLEHLEVGPPEALVERVEVDWSRYRSRFPNFEIRY